MFVSNPCKKLLLQLRTKNLTTHHPHHHLYVLQITSFSQTSESENLSDVNVTVNFLINSCGLSPEKALSTAKQIHPTFQSTKDKNLKSVITYLESNGFSKTHISKLISRQPRLLFSDVNKTFKPKIEQFHEFGFCGSKLADLISSKPGILLRSLKTQIIPSLELVRSFVKTDENVIKAIKRSMFFLSSNPKARMLPNINLFRELNVPESRISYILMTQPGALLMKTDALKEIVETVQKYGFKPESRMFTVAVHVLCSMSKSTLDAKIVLLKSLGWSEEQIFDSFRRFPLFLSCSEKKMKKGMDLYSKKLGWDASVLSRNPKFLMFSFEARVIPRLMVFEILMSKEIMEKEGKELIFSMLNMTEKQFLARYVIKYENKIPDLMNTYKNCKGSS